MLLLSYPQRLGVEGNLLIRSPCLLTNDIEGNSPKVGIRLWGNKNEVKLFRG